MAHCGSNPGENSRRRARREFTQKWPSTSQYALDRKFVRFCGDNRQLATEHFSANPAARGRVGRVTAGAVRPLASEISDRVAHFLGGGTYRADVGPSTQNLPGHRWPQLTGIGTTEP